VSSCVIVVCRAGEVSRRRLRLTLVDEDGAALDITGASVSLQGVSADLEKQIDVDGVVTDGPAGECEWDALGNLLDEADLSSRDSVDYSLYVRIEDAAGKVDYGSALAATFTKAPLVV